MASQKAPAKRVIKIKPRQSELPVSTGIVMERGQELFGNGMVIFAPFEAVLKADTFFTIKFGLFKIVVQAVGRFFNLPVKVSLGE